MKVQKKEIDELYTKIRDHVWVQDQLYKDYIRVEKNYANKEKKYKEKIVQLENNAQEEREKCNKAEKTLQTLLKGDPKATENQLIEMTKQNALLDMNLLRLTRKYNNLDEQEKMLRREYHNRDLDQAEKDLFLQKRIQDLKKWKAMALTQM